MTAEHNWSSQVQEVARIRRSRAPRLRRGARFCWTLRHRPRTTTTRLSLRPGAGRSLAVRGHRRCRRTPTGSLSLAGGPRGRLVRARDPRPLRTGPDRTTPASTRSSSRSTPERPPAAGIGQSRWARSSSTLDPCPSHLRAKGSSRSPTGRCARASSSRSSTSSRRPARTSPTCARVSFHKHRGVEFRFEGMGTRRRCSPGRAHRRRRIGGSRHRLLPGGRADRRGRGDPAAGRGWSVSSTPNSSGSPTTSTRPSATPRPPGRPSPTPACRSTKSGSSVCEADLCGSRFGRGVVVPGGVSRPAASEVRRRSSAAIDRHRGGGASRPAPLAGTPSFVDRLRATGVIPPETATPVRPTRTGRPRVGPDGGRPLRTALRCLRPLGHQLLDAESEGDALARQRVRNDEICGCIPPDPPGHRRLVGSGEPEHGVWRRPIEPAAARRSDGPRRPRARCSTWSRSRDGRLVRVKPRSASFHNLAFFHAAFPKDILTDFAFIEASFGLSIAGVAG